ncbi:hypothetical protein HUJ04_008576 [Dendroctonus ponderosae]|nr:hypothetical protein HUJ04_008576 [Dendroctonus ponderosae]KAH1008478.1 hypothetical protein HUJ05_009030 [Dendroctonus ponderosae]
MRRNQSTADCRYPSDYERRAPPAPAFHSAKVNVPLLGVRRLQMASSEKQSHTNRDQFKIPLPKRTKTSLDSESSDSFSGQSVSASAAALVEKPAELPKPKPSILKKRAPAPLPVEAAAVDERPVPNQSPRNGSGLLTDSLSCIFTRRNSQERKLPQKRAPYEEAPTEPQRDVEVADCPDPPRISQPTPDIRTEDWFTTKQRILGNVKSDTPQNISEPMKVPENSASAAQSEVDPHGFDIEPPAHMNKSVSPYVPSPSHERDEYEKYKSDKLKKEVARALLHRHYEASKKAQEAKKQQEENKARYNQTAENEDTGRRYEYGEGSRWKQVEESQQLQADEDGAATEYTETFEAEQGDDGAGDEDMEKYHVEKITGENQQYSYQSAQMYHYGSYESAIKSYETAQNAQVEESLCPAAPKISPMAPEQFESPSEEIPDGSLVPDSQYYSANQYQTSQSAIADNQTMCHKCSFQTTNPKKLRDHLKFVHGESVGGEAFKPAELFSRREPKALDNQDGLFTRRGDFSAQQGDAKKPTEVRFKRRNTAAATIVNIISSDVIVPAFAAADDAAGNSQETGVTAAMDYYETTKDQPKKHRPYRHDPEQLDKEWI